MTTRYITTEVGIDLEDFNDDDLIDELEYRGYTIIKDEAGYINNEVFALYQEWLADEGDNDRRFEKALRNFFSKHLNKNL